MAKRPDRPVYFTKLALENIRSFSERQELTLTDADGRPARWTLIVGDNGVGKTTLLQCLARMRPAFNRPADDDRGPQPNPVEPELAGEKDNGVLDALARYGPNTTATLNAQLSAGAPLTGPGTPRPGCISTSLSIARSKGRFTDFECGGEASPDIPGDIEEPLVLAYGAGRHPGTNGLDGDVSTGAVESLFRAEAGLQDAEDLLYRLEFGSLMGDAAAKARLESLKRVLVDTLPDVECTQDIEIHGPAFLARSPASTGVQVRTSNGSVPLGQLSLGIQTVFAWTVDMAWRLIDRYPDSPDPLHEPAIVIVDEIDLHLHPRWQRTIRERLAGHFPGVQFIATAHGPATVQSSLDANLAVVRKRGEHVEIVNDPVTMRDWRLDQVVTSDLFGLDSARSPQVEAMMNRRRELVDRRNSLSSEERSELAGLDGFVGELPTAESSADQEAMDIIRKAAAALKEV